TERGIGYTYQPQVEEGMYRASEYQYVPVKLLPYAFEITTQEIYERERQYLVADLQAFLDAVEEAGDDDVVDYIPLRVQQRMTGEAWRAGLVDLPDELGGVFAGVGAAIEGKREPIPETAAGWGTGKSPAVSDIAKLRQKTPDRNARDSVNPPGAKFDPIYGYPVVRYDADHIVPFGEVVQMPGFLELSFPKQVEVLNHPANFMGLGGRTNRSKQDHTWEEWPGHSKLGPVPANVRAEMVRRAAEVKESLQQAINVRRGQ
ncbi:MAG TPA: hypothetical protein VN181_08295, partial [Thermoanaerobaculia bacterium]|nr:hypothetical protein [Thermoanaerobaculia bacterium]